MLLSDMKPTIMIESLAKISLECIAKNLEDIFDMGEKGYELSLDVFLPREICESLIETYQQIGRTIDNKFLNIFNDKSKVYLQNVSLRHSIMTDEGLLKVLQFYLRELDIINCPHLTAHSFELIDKYGENLRSLSISPGVQIVPQVRFEKLLERKYFRNTRKLSRLVLKNTWGQSPEFFNLLILPLSNLTVLDLSSSDDLGDMRFLHNCPGLLSLTLFNCENLWRGISNICTLTKLRHLDLSQCPSDREAFENGNKILTQLISSLSNLTSLDISGTNLAGKGNFETDMFDEFHECHADIAGLASRTDNPLEFLGLYGTFYGACKRHDIPALKIAGDANEDQIITAATVYLNRPSMLQCVLNDLYHSLRAGACVNILKILKVLLDALNLHLQEKDIQISGTAALFYVVRGDNLSYLSSAMKKLVITTLLKCMDVYQEDRTLMRNSCLTLCHFRLPQDILFVYDRVVKLLLKIVVVADADSFIQRLGIYLMNSLACQVHDTQKEILGNLEIIEKMLKLINMKLANNEYDEILEVAWSAMWNVTDETPANCQRFLDSNGMECFTSCLKKFREKAELMRNMMGLLGNVSEVKELRFRLMPYIPVFNMLVDSFGEGIEVSYNAAGVIANIASDGEEAWDAEISREEVLAKMVLSIEKWQLNCERNINYRSFEPILKLVRVRHTPPCQLWAVWALANLTQVYPQKYYPILVEENGLAEMRLLASETNKKYPKIQRLAQTVLDNYERFNMNMKSTSEGSCDEENSYAMI